MSRLLVRKFSILILLFLLLSSSMIQEHYLLAQSNLQSMRTNFEIMLLDWNYQQNVIASAGYDENGFPLILIWDIGEEEGLEILRPVGLAGYLAIDWSSDGQYLAALRDNHTVEIWDVVAQQVLLTKDIAEFSSRDVYIGIWGALAWSPDNTKIAIVEHYYLSLWDISNDSFVTSNIVEINEEAYRDNNLNVLYAFLNDVEWSADGASIAIADSYSNLILLDSLSAEKLFFSISSLAKASERINTSQVHTSQTLCWNYNTQEIIIFYNLSTNSEHKSWLLWYDALTGEVQTTIEIISPIQAIACNSISNKLAFAYGDRGVDEVPSNYSVHVWEQATQEDLLILREHTSLITALSWNSDGTQLATSGWDGTIYIWEIPSNP